MIERAVTTLRSGLTAALLSIAFVVALLPWALLKRLDGGNLSASVASTGSYWLNRQSGATGFDLRSNDQMIVQIEGGSAFREFLKCTNSPRSAQHLAGALCLIVLGPLRRVSAQEDDSNLDPSIYSMH